jgi:aminomethyltransferase
MLTSGAFSPTLQAGIGMAYLPPALATPGTALAVDIRGRLVPAEVVRRPFYKRAE